MSEVVWLASYPKSGNTWFRMLVASLFAEGGSIDINELPETGAIASARCMFDHFMLIDSGLLTHDEIDSLRPRLHTAVADALMTGMEDEFEPSSETKFLKVHDAYTKTLEGEPLLGGGCAAKAAIVIVRDPRDIAASLAHHNGTSIDEAIHFMNESGSQFCGKQTAQSRQLRQKLLDWSGHVESWLEQRDVPVHLLRYEDMKRNAVDAFQAAMHFAGRSIGREAASSAVALADFGALRTQEELKGFKEAPKRGPARAFFRRGESGGWRDELTIDQVARIEAKHARIMRMLGYELMTLRYGAAPHFEEDSWEYARIAIGCRQISTTRSS